MRSSRPLFVARPTRALRVVIALVALSYAADARAFDPMVITGPGGRLYVMQGVTGGSFARAVGSAEAAQPPAIRIWSTTGDAWAWEGPTEIRPSVQPDHPRLVVDMSNGPHRGR